MLLKTLISFVLKVFAGSCRGCPKEMWLFPFADTILVSISHMSPLSPQHFKHWTSLILWRSVYSWYQLGRGKSGTVGTPRGNNQGWEGYKWHFSWPTEVMNFLDTTKSSCFLEQKIQGQNFFSNHMEYPEGKSWFFFSCEFPYLFIAACNIEENNGTIVHVYIINK